jgi:hypothetical protein
MKGLPPAASEKAFSCIRFQKNLLNPRSGVQEKRVKEQTPLPSVKGTPQQVSRPMPEK